MTVHIHNVILIPETLDYDTRTNSEIINTWFRFLDTMDTTTSSVIRQNLKQFDAILMGDYLSGRPDEVLFFTESGYTAFLLTYWGDDQ